MVTQLSVCNTFFSFAVPRQIESKLKVGFSFTDELFLYARRLFTQFILILLHTALSIVAHTNAN